MANDTVSYAEFRDYYTDLCKAKGRELSARQVISLDHLIAKLLLNETILDEAFTKEGLDGASKSLITGLHNIVKMYSKERYHRRPTNQDALEFYAIARLTHIAGFGPLMKKHLKSYLKKKGGLKPYDASMPLNFDWQEKFLKLYRDECRKRNDSFSKAQVSAFNDVTDFLSYVREVEKEPKVSISDLAAAGDSQTATRINNLLKGYLAQTEKVDPYLAMHSSPTITQARKCYKDMRRLVMIRSPGANGWGERTIEILGKYLSRFVNPSNCCY